MTIPPFSQTALKKKDNGRRREAWNVSWQFSFYPSISHPSPYKGPNRIKELPGLASSNHFIIFFPHSLFSHIFAFCSCLKKNKSLNFVFKVIQKWKFIKKCGAQEGNVLKHCCVRCFPKNIGSQVIFFFKKSLIQFFFFFF